MSSSRVVAAAALNAILAGTRAAQAPAPARRVTFDEAIALAIDHNPTIRGAATAILRAEGLIRQARAATLVPINGNVTTTTLNTGVEFQGTTVTPRNSLAASLTVDQPIVAAAGWAGAGEGRGAKDVAEWVAGGV